MLPPRNTPDWDEKAQSEIAKRLEKMHTGSPGLVTGFDSGTGRATVQPLIKCMHLDEAGEVVAADIAPIAEVPVIMPVILPIKKGDVVWLAFSESSMDKLIADGIKRNGRTVDPADGERFTLNDAVAFPWIVTGPQIEITETEIRIGGSDALVTVTEHNAHIHAVAGVTAGAATVPSAVPTTPAVGTTHARG